MSSMNSAARAGLALALAVFAVPALAGSVPSNPESIVNAQRSALKSASVVVTASDLADAQSEGALMRRVKTAATNACSNRLEIELSSAPGYNGCVDELVADARIAMPSHDQLASTGGSVNMVLR